MKHRLAFLLVLVLPFLATPLRADWPEERCVTVQTRHYYSDTHRDSVLRNIDVCLSPTAKSVEYEVPALPQPLTLTAASGTVITATVTDMAYPNDPVQYEGEVVTFELPDRGEGTKYRLRVEVPVNSLGLITGSMDGNIVGQIIIGNEVSGNALSRMTRTNMYVALGGLWGELWFTTLARPSGATVQVAVIPEPAPGANGSFLGQGLDWQQVWYEELDSPAVVLSEDWQPGGYFVLRVSLPNPLTPTRLPDLGQHRQYRFLPILP